MNSSKLILVLALLLLSFNRVDGDNQVLKVRHDHDPFGACQGELRVNEQGIHYIPGEKEAHQREWSWTEIQTVDRISPARFTVLTYQDQKLLLGKDRPWDFKVLDLESGGLTDELFALILEYCTKPLVDRVRRDITVEYEIPVKHLHTFGGCEGVLRFGDEWITYETDHSKDQRSWRREEEVASIWSTNRFDLELEVFEKDGADLLKTRRFRYQLKEPLDYDYYNELRRELFPRR